MEFLKLIQAFEELLFEILSWLIYYPLTLWKVVRHPLRMVDYSKHELADSPEARYTDALSPPLLLLLTIALLYAVESALAPLAGDAGSGLVRTIGASHQNLVLLRSFLFGLLPLVAAVASVHLRRLPLDRRHLRPAFFGECYLIVPYAFVVALSTHVSRSALAGGTAIGATVFVIGTVWYLGLRVLQVRKTAKVSIGAAITSALLAYLSALIYGFTIVAVLASAIG